MQQTADWLEKLGLAQYAQRFAENDITFANLPDPTDQDVKSSGWRHRTCTYSRTIVPIHPLACAALAGYDQCREVG
jgi:SAM (Sterile alpha motif) domain-containing protein